MIRLRMKTDSTRLERQLSDIQERLTDFRPLFDILRREFLIRRIHEIFASDGEGAWPPTGRANPILRDTLALIQSYTQAGVAGNVNIETPTKLTWGSSLPYAQFHEFGTEKLPPRPVLEVLTSGIDGNTLARIADEWIQRL